MKTQLTTIEEIRTALHKLRQDPNTKRKFPQELWSSIIQLTKIYPLEDVCRQIDINPVYLKRKIQQSKEKTIEFREITFSTSLTPSNAITIELNSHDGLKAKIQGPISCLDCLYKLFGK